MLLSENKYDDDDELILMTNRKLRMLFRLAPRSMALDDLELLYKFEFSRNSACFRRFWKQQRLNEWK